MTGVKTSSNTLVFICLVLFFDSMGVALILPVMPELITELSDLPNSEAARIGGYLLFTFAGMQFFAAPILGGLSDRFGRRPVLLLALLGFSLDYFVMAVAPTLAWLFVARLISGLFGATYAAANASIVDITAPEDRARNFGLLGAATGLGFIFGPVMGGLLGEYNARLPFIVAGILALATCVYGYFVFPETLTPEKRRPFELKRANPFGSLISIARHPIVIILMVSLFLIQLAGQSYVSIWSFFTIEVAGWSPLGIGLSAAAYGATLALVQGFLTGPVVKRYGEVRAGVFSIAVGILTYVGLAFADSGPSIYFWILVGGLSGFAFPAMQSLMTRNVPEDAQGELQGAIASTYSLSAIAGPLVMAGLFSHYTGTSSVYFPGAAFLGAAVLISLSLVVFIYGTRRLPKHDTAQTS
ncbi:MAG: TCR/Tet family MFS transporter [Hyphomonadaceae bacterium]